MPAPKFYHRPSTLPEALTYLQEPDSIAVAGGGFLLRGVTLPYRTVIDLQDMAELRGIASTRHHLRIGGNTSLQEIVTSGTIDPFLKRALTRTLPVNQRSGISVGESLVVREPPAEWLAALAVMEAALEHTGFRPGEPAAGMIPVEEFVKRLAEYGFPYRGIIIALHLPVATGGVTMGAAHVARTPADIPIVNAAAVVHLDADRRIRRLRIALGGVSSLPVLKLSFDTLAGKSLNEAAIAEAIRQVDRQINPVDNYRGSAAYRRAMAPVMVRRALAECLDKP